MKIFLPSFGVIDKSELPVSNFIAFDFSNTKSKSVTLYSSLELSSYSLIIRLWQVELARRESMIHSECRTRFIFTPYFLDQGVFFWERFLCLASDPTKKVKAKGAFQLSMSLALPCVLKLIRFFNTFHTISTRNFTLVSEWRFSMHH